MVDQTSSTAEACSDSAIEKAVKLLNLPESQNDVVQILSISLGWLELIFLILYCFALSKSSRIGKPSKQDMQFEGGEREGKGKKKD